jgi:hypothetical protein
MNAEFKITCSKYPRLNELLQEQRANELPRDKWLLVMRLLIDSGRIALARTFSMQSLPIKHESQ